VLGFLGNRTLFFRLFVLQYLLMGAFGMGAQFTPYFLPPTAPSGH